MSKNNAGAAPPVLPAWTSLLEAVRVVARQQTGDGDIAARMADEWVRSGAVVYEPEAVTSAYGQAVAFLREAMRAGQIVGRGRALSDAQTRPIEAFEWAGYYCDFRRSALTSERERPGFIEISQIETRSLLAALDAEKAPAAKARGGRPPVLERTIIVQFVFDLMTEHGDFLPGDNEWDSQARLEEEVRAFIKRKTGRSPAVSTVRGHVQQALRQWRTHRAEN